MRQIKFRAWDGKKMHLPEHCDQQDFFVTPEGEVRYIHEVGVEGHITDSLRRGWVLQQFTGKSCKRGNDIYDGDILAQDCAMIDDYTGKTSVEVQYLVVRWCQNKLCWSVYCPSAMITNDWEYIPGNAYKVGNIYENKNFLTPTPAR